MRIAHGNWRYGNEDKWYGNEKKNGMGMRIGDNEDKQYGNEDGNIIAVNRQEDIDNETVRKFLEFSTMPSDEELQVS